MMKKLFFLLVFLSIGMQAQNVNIPDANFKAKLLEADITNNIAQTWTYNYNTGDWEIKSIKIDTNNDGEIELAEAYQHIDYLDISNSNISSLEGFENFAEVYNLDCSNNNLSTLDFSGRGYMQSVICDNNKITSLNIPIQIEALFSCSGNLLTSFENTMDAERLDLSNNLFKELNFSNGNVYGLNISDNPNLEHLNIKDKSTSLATFLLNNASGFNIENCPNLKLICVNEVDKSAIENIVAQNNYTNCNVSVDCFSSVFEVNIHNSYLKQVLLSADITNGIAKDSDGNAIRIDSNGDSRFQYSEIARVAELNIINNINIGLEGVKDLNNFTNLTKLVLDNLNISTIDINGFTKLKYLDVSNNNIQYLNYYTPVALPIETFIAKNTGINRIVLTNLKNLKYLDLSNNPEIYQLDFSQNINLSYLDITGLKKLSIEPGPYDGTVPIKGLDNTKLVIFKANDCNFKTLPLKNFNLLETLYFQNNKLTTLNTQVAKKIKNIYCNNNLIESIFFDQKSLIEKLYINDNKIKALDVNLLSHLQEIALFNNPISSVNCKNNSNENFISLNGVPAFNNTTFTSICVDADQLETVKTLLTNEGKANVNVNSSCTSPEAIVYFEDAYGFKSSLIKGTIAKDLNGNTVSVDLNGDGEIQYSEAENISEIHTDNGIDSLIGILSFKNLKKLYVTSQGFGLNFIDLHGLSKLEEFTADYTSDVKNLILDDCINLKKIDIRWSFILNSISFNNVHSLESFKINSIGTYFNNLDLSNQPNLKFVSINNNAYSLLNLNLQNSPNLEDLSIIQTPVGVLDISNHPNLKYLTIANASLSSINLNGTKNLVKIDVSDIGNSGVNYLTSLDISGMNFLTDLNCSGNRISALDLASTNELKKLNCAGNKLTNLEISNLNKLTDLNCNDNLLSNLSVTNSPNLINLSFTNNQLSNLILNNIPLLEKLECNNNLLTNLDLQYLTKLQILDCNENKLSNLDLTKNADLKNINVSLNNLTNLDVITNVNLTTLNCDNNKLSSLDVTKNLNLSVLNCGNNQLTQLDISQNKDLIILQTNNNSLKTLDLSNNIKLHEAYFNFNPNLESLFLKNSKPQVFGDYFEGPFFKNTAIKYICADDSEVETIKSILADEGKIANVNSYCSFTPGGTYNTISGTAKFDAGNNGCDATDNPFEYLKLKIDDGTNPGETFVQNNGKYEFYTQAGNFTVTPQAENPGLFNVSPANFSTSFADNNSNIFTQDICVTANGNQNDAEVVIAPLTGARPGFDATYKLVWRNKGNTTLSGKVILNFDANKMAFKESSLPYSAISNGSVEFDYTNLKPYANDGVEITFTINTPTNPTNPVNSGDILAFYSQITPNNGDLSPDDNHFAFNHTVVNSFDPNDIVCMEGETIPSVAVGKYMHYVVNFENTGTAEAENIVVKMNIDPAEFDISTLQLQNASAAVTTVITGNQAEFLFKKIKLKSGGHGNVLLKIKSVTSLQEGDQVNNKANIYFDYNFPVETNDYVTTVQDQNSVLAAKINYEADDFTSGNYPVNFDGSFSTGAVTSYLWEFSGNPSVSDVTTANPVVTYSSPGHYSAKLTVYDAGNNASSQTVAFKIGDNLADLSTGKDSNGNYISIDSDEDDWKGYDINGVLIIPKARHTYTGWSSADIGNGSISRWITLNTSEGYFTYKSVAFTVPENATDARIKLRSLSFVRNWTYLVKVNPDGSEEEIEITKTKFLGDGAKGWLNSRSPMVDLPLSPGRYYIKVLVYSNNPSVRQSLDVNAQVSCSAGLMYINKKVADAPTLNSSNTKMDDIKIYPIPVKDDLTIVAKDFISSIEVYDASGRIVQKQFLDSQTKNTKININSPKGVYYLKIKTTRETITRKVIKE